MGKRRFELEFMGIAEIELDDAVINAVDDQWRAELYDLRTPEQIAEMVGRCMVCLGMRLSSLDGWADQPDENAKIISSPDWEVARISELGRS